MIAVNDATPAMGTVAACRALGLSRATLYRGRRPAVVARPRSAPPRTLALVERQGVLELLHTRFVDQAPAQVHATLLDEGTYLCSPRTMYRLLDGAREIKERRNQVRRPHYAAPELLALRPNEVWSWDITKLLGPAKWTYFYLYVILDIFSRYVVGWMIAPHESAALAERLIAETCAKHDISRASSRSTPTAARRCGASPWRSSWRISASRKPTAVHTSRTTIPFQKPSSRRSNTVRSFRSASGRSKMAAPLGEPFSAGTTTNTSTAASVSSRPRSSTSARPRRCGRSGNRSWRPPMRDIPSAS